MAKRRKIEVPVSLLKLTTDQFFYSDSLSSEVNKAELMINHSIQYGLDTSDSTAGCIYKFELTKEDGNVLLVIEAGAHFKIDTKAFEKLFDKKKKIFTLPLSTACNMLGVAIGVARGILHAKTEGTDVNGVFIPLIDPEEIVSEDLLISIPDDKEISDVV